MPKDPASLKIANDSGFPLQIAVEHHVTQSSSTHGWKVRYAEHAWTNPLDQQSGFIDLVLQDKHKSTFLVIECKRQRNATWLFMHSNGTAKNRRHAKLWVSHYSGGRMKRFGWHDLPVDPDSPETPFCAIRGQSTNDKSTMLERIGGELIFAALAAQERDFRRANQDIIRFYPNVVVTTAELKVARFAQDAISLADGTMADADIVDVPFLRFRKPLSSRSTQLTAEDYDNSVDPAYEKQNTIFVVRADALLDFLRRLEVPDSSVREIQFN